MDDNPKMIKNFWQRPEGVVGGIALVVAIVAISLIAWQFLPFLISLTESILSLSLMLLTIAAIAYLVFDPKMRTFVWYMFQSVMRWITGLFIQIDPIGILKSYIEDLSNNLRKMYRQIGKLRGQMHILNEQIHLNNKDIDSNLSLAKEAKKSNKRSAMILKSRKAGRLRDSNIKLEELYKKMEILYKVLVKMYENSEILVEDVKDQVAVKEKEREAIHAGHSAMQSAMNMISGNTDKRLIFNEALEAVADDVADKVGEMEQFMELSENFMASIDLRNGVFEEKGLAMLEKWEKEGPSRLLGEEKKNLLDNKAEVNNKSLKMPEKAGGSSRSSQSKNQYDAFFD